VGIRTAIGIQKPDNMSGFWKPDWTF
jgi:hypothetical protein